ncbi:MAG TPA: hypothetical protein VN415_03615, partial [Dehalococcoidia bacterium]|nr:hypothetical protein [Dehalococcoidia bacterium]
PLDRRPATAIGRRETSSDRAVAKVPRPTRTPAEKTPVPTYTRIVSAIPQLSQRAFESPKTAAMKNPKPAKNEKADRDCRKKEVVGRARCDGAFVVIRLARSGFHPHTIL